MDYSSVLLILPVYNEEVTVANVIKKIFHYTREKMNILIIDDGSTDSTSTIIQKNFSNHPRITLLRKQQNEGYGASLISGFEFALEKKYFFWITMDCDEQHQPKDIQRFLEIDPSIQLISGSRYHPQSKVQGIEAPQDRMEINFRITRLLNDIYKLNITDAFCGFKRYLASAFRDHKFQVKGYGSPLELWSYVKWKNISIRELPVDRIYITDDRSFGEDLDKKRKRYRYYLKTWINSHRKYFGTNLQLNIKEPKK